MKQLTIEQVNLLRSPLPSEAVTQHPTKIYLSSIKAIYVTERLNAVFGIGAWRTKVEKESVSDAGMVVVKVTFEVPDYGIYYESYGGNDNGGGNSKNFDLGDAFKGATTDAITKIGSFLEIGIDVFKGKHKGNNAPMNEALKIDVWLTDKQFEQVKLLNPNDVKACLNKYNGKVFTDGKVYAMKKEFRTELEKLI